MLLIRGGLFQNTVNEIQKVFKLQRKVTTKHRLLLNLTKKKTKFNYEN